MKSTPTNRVEMGVAAPLSPNASLSLCLSVCLSPTFSLSLSVCLSVCLCLSLSLTSVDVTKALFKATVTHSESHATRDTAMSPLGSRHKCYIKTSNQGTALHKTASQRRVLHKNGQSENSAT